VTLVSQGDKKEKYNEYHRQWYALNKLKKIQEGKKMADVSVNEPHDAHLVRVTELHDASLLKHSLLGEDNIIRYRDDKTFDVTTNFQMKINENMMTDAFVASDAL
jgi:hypothetical protein